MWQELFAVIQGPAKGLDSWKLGKENKHKKEKVGEQRAACWFNFYNRKYR